MTAILTDNLAVTLAILILVSRLGDILSTYLVTPSLKLEANLLVRKLGWRFAAATTVIALVPFYNTGLGVMVLVPSLLVSAANFQRVWAARALGEQAYADWVRSLARKSKLSAALKGVAASVFFTALAGSTLLLLSPNSDEWGFWFALGILVYAFAVAFHSSLYFWRLFKKVREEPPIP